MNSRNTIHEITRKKPEIGWRVFDKFRAISWIVFLSVFSLAIVAFLISSRLTASEARSVATPQKRRSVRRPQAQKPRVDYAHFSHRTHVEKQKLKCDSCHKLPTKNWKDVRKGDAAFADVADFPEHSSCLSCHREQFFARERPAPVICSNCHIAVTPRDTTRYLFPSLGDVTDSTKKRRDFVSEFQVNFPHDKHVDLIGQNQRRGNTDDRVRFAFASFSQEKPKEQETQPKSCPVCHQTYQPQGNSPDEYVTKPPKNLGDTFWLKKGTFKTVPVSHTQCATCHNADSGIDPAPSNCNACHKLLPAGQNVSVDYDPKLAATMGITDRVILGRWRRRESSGTFPHEGGLHPNVICTACHTIATMNTVEPKTLKVAVKSCSGAEGCHITATSDDGGALNLEIDQRKAKPDFQCTKCHIVFGNQPMPPNHFEAIPKPVKK
jgi:Cytochrome c7 and related cytochrome c